MNNKFFIVDAVPYGMARFTAGTGPISLNNVNCLGTETNVLSCTFDPNLGSCSHSNDAGVGCRSESKIILASSYSCMLVFSSFECVAKALYCCRTLYGR